jgi:2,4-dienoyl-CoA reductase (NADPH2)
VSENEIRHGISKRRHQIVSTATRSAPAAREPDGTQYSYLMSPLRVGGLTLANRGVMGAMHTRLETLDRAWERIYAFYRARSEGEIGLILTGGISPNREGRLEDDAPVLDRHSERWTHEAIIAAVQGAATKVCMQILHAGRYAKHPDCVGPSTTRARINRYAPRALTTEEVWRTIADYAEAAAIAREIGYHGVEVMGSEGYLINQFTAPRTNDRADEFGGDLTGRMRFPTEIVSAIRARVGQDFLLIYRISAMDLVDGGMDGDETAELARGVVAAGADMLNTGIGWHESPIPTVAHVVPRAAWSFATAALKKAVSVPVIASNRINDPRVADRLIAEGTADLVSMARPLLADPHFMRKARLGSADLINTCIACNQACLDRIFSQESASCLVNPIAGHEIEFPFAPVARSKRLAVVGGGAAGMAFSIAAAQRGHSVTLFEAARELGGQLLMARAIPLKSEFNEMLRFFRRSLDREDVKIRLGTRVDVTDLISGPFDEVVVATGVRPREPLIPGIDHPTVLDYPDVLLRGAHVGERVVIVGAGGIGFDTAEYLLETPFSAPVLGTFVREYGLDPTLRSRGGLAQSHDDEKPRRRIIMLQRSPARLGSRLAISTGWIHRQKLARLDVEMIAGVAYEKIDDEGLHIVIGGAPRILRADTIVICAGQESERGLYDDLRAAAPTMPVHVIGGADFAAELDAMRAIDQASRLAQII